MLGDIWLELENIDVIKDNKYLLSDINLKLYEGEIITILGPNGAGKSSLINLINRTLYPVIKKHSKIAIFGKELINIWDLKKNISIVNKDIEQRINRYITSEEVILSGLYGSIGINKNQSIKGQDRLKSELIINRFGLSKIKKTQYQLLSEGEKRKVLIARSIINDPKVVILDEPTINLDMKSYYQLFEMLSELVKSKVTILIVTHNIESIIKETNRVILIKNGKIKADGKPKDVMNSELINSLYETNIELINLNGNWKVITKH